MDLLYQRYAGPISFLDIAISQKRLCEVVSLVIDKYNEKMEWEYYLHKINTDISFEDFKEHIRKANGNLQPNEKIDFETTVLQTQNILEAFNPYYEQKGV